MADINRFMTPAEIPQPSFFQLPYEQLKQGLLVAQQQQDDAKQGLSVLGDTQFNYLTNPQDIKLAEEQYKYIDNSVEGILSKQGAGDLRGLRNDIYGVGKNVSRLFRPDQAIGKLQANHAAFNDWLKKQLDNKELDQNYLKQAAKFFIDDYDAKGGARTGSIYTENLQKFFDPSKFVNDNKDMIKSTLIQRERDRLGNNGYKYTDEQLLKQIPPDRVKYTLSQILQSNPEYNSSLSQRVRLGNLGQESIPLMNEKGELNPYNPAASAIHGAMTGLGVVEESRNRFSIGTDEPYWKRQEQAEKEKTEQLMISMMDHPLNGNTQEIVNNAQKNYDPTDPNSIQALENATQPYAEIIKKHIMNTDGSIKPAFKPYFEGVTDVKGNTIDPNDIVKAYTLAMHNPKGNLGNGVYVNEDVLAKVLENTTDANGNKKYKLNYTLEDGLPKKLGSLLTGLTGVETDVPKLNILGRDFMGTFNKEFNKGRSSLFKELKETEIKLKSQEPVSQQGPRYNLNPETKNVVGQQLQKLGSLSSIANGFNYVTTDGSDRGVLTDYLKDKNFDKDVTFSATPDLNGNNRGGLRYFATFKLQNKKGHNTGEVKEIEVFPKNNAVLNQMEATFSEALYKTRAFTVQQPSINEAGNVARFNVYGAINNSALDENINAFTNTDVHAKTILQTSKGAVATIKELGTYKKISDNSIMFIGGPKNGTAVFFNNESDLKQKLQGIK